MKIKLLSREIKIVKIAIVSDKLDVNNRGIADKYSNEIYVLANSVMFKTILHEIKHLYSFWIGTEQLQEFDKEVDCDLFAACIEQLMLENGDDTFARLKRFAEN